MPKIEIYEDGQPCKHPGCINHVTHACEYCKRKQAKNKVMITKQNLEIENSCAVGYNKKTL